MYDVTYLLFSELSAAADSDIMEELLVLHHSELHSPGGFLLNRLDGNTSFQCLYCLQPTSFDSMIEPWLKKNLHRAGFANAPFRCIKVDLETYADLGYVVCTLTV